jgi:leucyl-tRNA synthetase
MQFHNAVKSGYFDLANARDQYRANCTRPMHRGLVAQYMQVSLILLAPICPHWCEHMWKLASYDGFVLNARWPELGVPDAVLARKVGYLRDTANTFRSLLTKQRETRKKQMAKQGAGADVKADFDCCTLYVAGGYPAWQAACLQALGDVFKKDGALPSSGDLAGLLRDLPIFNTGGVPDKKGVKNAMAFVAQVAAGVNARGIAALELALPFDEMEFLNEQLHTVYRDSGIATVTVELQPVDRANDKDAALPGKPKALFYHSSTPP